MANLSRDASIKTKQNFNKVFRGSNSFYVNSFRILVSNYETDKPKLGIIIPKRIIPLATRRNALKRQVREAFRREEILENHDYVVLLIKKPNAESTANLFHSIYNNPKAKKGST